MLTEHTSRHRMLPCVLLASAWLGACAPALVAQGSGSGCLTASADTVRVPERLDFLKQLVSSTDSDYVVTRQDLGIGTMNPSKVTLVTKQTTCQSAANALNTVRQEPSTVRQIWVYALGTAGYAVDDPGLDRSDVAYADKVMYFFDRTFTYKQTLSGF